MPETTTANNLSRLIGKTVIVESSEIMMIPTQNGPGAVFPSVKGRLVGFDTSFVEIVLDGEHQSSFFTLSNVRSVRPPPSEIAMPRRDMSI